MSTRIAVLSDSHVGQRISVYPPQLLVQLAESDLIVHAGDHTSLESVETLAQIGELRAIHGNMDEIAVNSLLPAELLLDVEGFKVGVVHGSGQPLGLEHRVKAAFESRSIPPDIIIFGHSHCPFDENIGGIRLINPGAVSGNILSKKGSWGFLTLEGNKASWELFELPL